MTGLEQLLAEAQPDGQFGGPVTRPFRPAWTPEQQDEHYNRLAEAIGAPYRTTPTREAA